MMTAIIRTNNRMAPRGARMRAWRGREAYLWKGDAKKGCAA
jgi:hypothetical protein